MSTQRAAPRRAATRLFSISRSKRPSAKLRNSMREDRLNALVHHYCQELYDFDGKRNKFRLARSARS